MSSSEESGALVTDMPEVSPQSQTFGSLDAAEPSLLQATDSTDDRKQSSARSVSPDLQYLDEFRLSSPTGPVAPQPAAASRSPLPMPERVSERYDSNPYLSLPRSGNRGEPVLTDFRAKPASYENAELMARLSPPYLDSTGDSSGGELVKNGRSFHDMDPAEIDFDTRQAYQSLGELAVPNKYEKVPPGIYSTPRPLSCNCKTKRSSTVPTVLCCTLILAALALVFAIGGTSIAVYNLLEAPESTTSEVEKLELQLKASQSMIVLLNDAVEELRREMALLSARTQNESQDLYLSLVTSRNEALREVREEVNAVSATVDSILDPNRTTRIQELHPYQNCTTTIITQCSITSGLHDNPPSFASCETPLVSRNRLGYQNLDLHCSVVDTDGEQDPIIATLVVDESEDKAGCLCYVTAFSSGVNQITCAMYATRCLQSVYLDTLMKLP